MIAGYQYDASTLPPAPAGYAWQPGDYGFMPQLVKLQPTGVAGAVQSHRGALLLLGAGVVALWWFTRGKKAGVSLPVMQTNPFRGCR